jgi:hypothetical protein
MVDLHKKSGGSSELNLYGGGLKIHQQTRAVRAAERD